MKPKRWESKKPQVCVQSRSNVYVKWINGLPQVRERDCRNVTGDFKQGAGLNEPPKDQYCYAGRIMDGDCEVTECFEKNLKNRLCIVNGYESATQRSCLQAPPRWSLFDPKTRERLYEIAEDVDGNKVICVVDECNARKRLVNTNQINYRLYDSLINDKGWYWSYERRDLKGSGKKTKEKKRLCVSQSCNGKLLRDRNCCNGKQERSLIYEQRRGHCLSKTKFACNQRPVVNRVW